MSIKQFPITVLILLCLAVTSLPTYPATPGRVGVIAIVNGQVFITSGTKTFKAKPGSLIHEGDKVRALNPAKAKIVFIDDTVINIGRDTEFTVTKSLFSLDRRIANFDFSKGRFKVAVGKFPSGASEFKVKTPNAIVGVRGTVFWGDTNLDAICTLEGEVEVTPLSNESAARPLKAGECAAEFKAGRAIPLTPTAEALKGYMDEVTPR